MMCPLDWTIRFKIMIRRLFKSDNADRVKIEKPSLINTLKMVMHDLLICYPPKYVMILIKVHNFVKTELYAAI